MRANVWGALLLAMAMVATGCNDDNNRLAELDTARQVASANLQTEAAERKAGDLDAIAQARAYIDSQLAGTGLGTRIDAEAAARKQADDQVLDSAKAYVDTLRGRLTVGHLEVVASKVDLGRHRGGPITTVQIKQQDYDVDWITPIVVAWSGPNCTGNAFVRGPVGSLSSTWYVVGGGGQLANIDSELAPAKTVSETMPDGTCQPNSGTDPATPVLQFLPAKQTDDAVPIVRYKGRELRTRDVPALP